MKKKTLKLLLFTFLVCGVYACYEPNEACLDFYASNYDLTADNNCDDCCTFPDLIMQFSHRYNDSAFAMNDTLLDDFGNPFVLRDFDFLISNIELVDMIGNSHFIEESISITANGITDSYLNDFANVVRDISSYEIGSIKIKDPINSIRFTMGIELRNIDFSGLDTLLVLSQVAESHYSGGDFFPWKLEIERDTMSGISTVIDAAVSDNRTIVINKALNNTIGNNIRVPIIIEYKTLLEGINMNSSTDAEISALINANLEKAFN